MRVAIVSSNEIELSGRVQRLSRALAAAGHDVHVFAPAFRKQPRVAIDGVSVTTPFMRRDRTARLQGHALRWSGAVASRIGLSGPGEALFARQTHLRDLRRSAERIAETAPFDVVVAHHWTTVPVARSLVERQGATLVFDQNEHSSAEHRGNGLRLWPAAVLARRSLVHVARRARLVISPCEAYLDAAREIFARHGEAGERPAFRVVRNVVSRRDIPERREQEAEEDRPLNIVFQGLVLPNRRLALILDSMHQWPPGTRLTIQALGSVSELEQINRNVLRHPRSEHIRLVPPVPAMSMVGSLGEMRGDLGLCFFDPALEQVAGALPNKLFVFLASGMGVLACDGTASGDLIRRENLGEVADDFSAEGLARIVATAERRMRENGRLSLRERAHAYTCANSWESEAPLFVSAVEEAHRNAAGSAPRPGR